MFALTIGSLTFPWSASKRDQCLTSTEARKGYRVLGGDQGDLRFGGYATDETGTDLYDVVLVTAHEGLTEDEAKDIAESIVLEAYESIGAECIEHS